MPGECFPLEAAVSQPSDSVSGVTLNVVGRSHTGTVATFQAADGCRMLRAPYRCRYHEASKYSRNLL